MPRWRERRCRRSDQCRRTSRRLGRHLADSVAADSGAAGRGIDGGDDQAAWATTGRLSIRKADRRRGTLPSHDGPEAARREQRRAPRVQPAAPHAPRSAPGRRDDQHGRTRDAGPADPALLRGCRRHGERCLKCVREAYGPRRASMSPIHSRHGRTRYGYNSDNRKKPARPERRRRSQQVGRSPQTRRCPHASASSRSTRCWTSAAAAASSRS